MGIRSRYSVGGRTNATAATIDAAGGGLWNPSANKTVFLYEIIWTKTAATADNQALAKTTARGTPLAGSITPTAASNGYGVTDPNPGSGIILDLGYSVQPTLAALRFGRRNLSAQIGANLIWVFPEPFEIGPGTGVVIITPVGVILQAADVEFVFEE